MNTNTNLITEFQEETKVRLLADKIRVAGLNARIAEDYFNEYVGLADKKNYVEDRIVNAENTLADFESYCQRFEVTREVVESYQDYILNGIIHEIKLEGVAENFYRESKFKSANDEMIEALQEFAVASKSASPVQAAAKLKMAKLLFNLPNQTDEILNAMSERFMKNNLCAKLISQLKVKSMSGEAKWKKYGALVQNGKISTYCNVKLSHQDYIYSASDALNDIQNFVKADLKQYAPQEKKKKFTGIDMRSLIRNMVKQIS